jgi:hypothetical protein
MKTLEQIFNLPTDDDSKIIESSLPSEIDLDSLIEIDDVIDRIDAALPTVRDLSTADRELDELAEKATETFSDLISLGYQVDSRYSAEILSVASSMFGHALAAKQAKLNKKLKIVELQLKKAKLDFDKEKSAKPSEEILETAEGQLLSRNDLLDRILNHGKSDETS